jgi:tetratricopeptide (TPR) repeat protein
MGRLVRISFGVALLVAVVAPPAEAVQGHGGGAADRKAPPLYDDLGSYQRKITTASPSVQAYFDQGLRLLFAFNLEEAQRSFQEAVARDADCAMCWWGLGMSLSPHYNLPGLAERTAAGARAVASGLAVAEGKPAVEGDLLRALAKRLADPAPASMDGFYALDAAYAGAMKELAASYPADLDIQAYYAEALMNLRPWQLWNADGTPAPGTMEIVERLEAVLAKDENHPGANHMLIHALEASPMPERAVAAAERVGKTTPGAAHMVHMPSHIWAQVGRWADAAAANREAIEVDRKYLGASPEAAAGFYGMYAAHNYQFLWWSACQTGRYAEAIENARAAAGLMSFDTLRAFPGMDFFLGYPIWTQIRFGRWAEALGEAEPPTEFVYAHAVWRAGRGAALARLGRLDDARAELRALDAARVTLPKELVIAFTPVDQLVGLARDWVAGEIALAAGDLPTAVASFRSAFDAEGRLTYNEPPDWYISVAPAYGEALLAAGDAAGAAAAFRTDLERYPENGWSLAGLAKALARQGQAAEAARLEARFRAVWGGADSAAPFAGAP